MYKNIEKEHVLLLDGKYLFSRRTGGATLSAESVFNSSLNPLGSGLPTITVHEGPDRRSKATIIPTHKVAEIVSSVVDVPSDVLDMMKPVDGESDEDKELRLDYIRWYFESL